MKDYLIMFGATILFIMLFFGIRGLKIMQVEEPKHSILVNKINYEKRVLNGN